MRYYHKFLDNYFDHFFAVLFLGWFNFHVMHFRKLSDRSLWRKRRCVVTGFDFM